MRSDVPIKIVAWLFILWVAFLARRAPAQEVRADSGAKVRVYPAAEPKVLYEGRLLSLTRDSVVVAVPGAGHMRWARHAVARFDVGRRGSRAGGTFIGIGVGAAVGAGLGAALGYATSDNSDYVFDRNVGAAIGAFFIGIAGGVTGGIVGYNHPPTRWREVPLTVGLQRRGLGVSIAF